MEQIEASEPWLEPVKTTGTRRSSSCWETQPSTVACREFGTFVIVLILSSLVFLASSFFLVLWGSSVWSIGLAFPAHSFILWIVCHTSPAYLSTFFPSTPPRHVRHLDLSTFPCDGDLPASILSPARLPIRIAVFLPSQLAVFGPRLRCSLPSSLDPRPFAVLCPNHTATSKGVTPTFLSRSILSAWSTRSFLSNA